MSGIGRIRIFPADAGVNLRGDTLGLEDNIFPADAGVNLCHRLILTIGLEYSPRMRG